MAPYAVDSLVRVDEAAGWVYYTAYSGDNPLDAQLHRVRLDGTQHVRLTNRAATLFSVPDRAKSQVVRRYVRSRGHRPYDRALQRMPARKWRCWPRVTRPSARNSDWCAPELFTFKAADGTTDLQGILHKPAHFDPNRKYPLVDQRLWRPSLYAASRTATNRPNPYCEFGFLMATIANRGTTERGKAFETATYLKLGTVDIQDQVDGVKFLCQRPYVDATRVGIFGHSYGGYMSTLAIVRYPDVFHVAVAGAPVTDWRNYDTIYTERYMRTPQENPDGYRDGSCLTYAKNLKGHLLLMHGLIDDNVHPSNTWQMVDAFQRENLRFDLMVFPRSKHGLGGNSSSLQWEYLHEHLASRCRSSRATAIRCSSACWAGSGSQKQRMKPTR